MHSNPKNNTPHWRSARHRTLTELPAEDGQPEIGRFIPNLRWKRNHFERSAGSGIGVCMQTVDFGAKTGGLTAAWLLDVIPALPVSPFFRIVRGSQRGARWRGNICVESVPPLCAHCEGSAPEQTKSSNHGVFTKVSTALLRCSPARRWEDRREGRKKGKYCLPVLNVSV